MAIISKCVLEVVNESPNHHFWPSKLLKSGTNIEKDPKEVRWSPISIPKSVQWISSGLWDPHKHDHCSQKCPDCLLDSILRRKLASNELDEHTAVAILGQGDLKVGDITLKEIKMETERAEEAHTIERICNEINAGIYYEFDTIDITSRPVPERSADEVRQYIVAKYVMNEFPDEFAIITVLGMIIVMLSEYFV